MQENILLVYGGNSVEHEISIITALQAKAKYKGKYNLILCYLRNGVFYMSPNLDNIDFYKSLDKNLRKCKKITFIANNNHVKYGRKKLYFNAVLLVVHGSNCEDGTLYSYFKTLNIDVIAENITSATIGQNKYLTKKCCNVEILPYIEITNIDYRNNLPLILEKVNELGYPAISKPINLGSSVGVYSIKDEDELLEKLNELLHLSNSILIEKQLNNFTELNIAAFRYKDELILSNIEKVSNGKVLSYMDKYVNKEKSMSGQTRELPAKIDDKLTSKLKEMATQVYDDLKALYIVRMDFLYDNINKKLYFNEINNIPGSLALYLFDIDSSKLIDMYIDEGLKDIDENKKIITSYNDNIFNKVTFNNVKFHK